MALLVPPIKTLILCRWRPRSQPPHVLEQVVHINFNGDYGDGNSSTAVVVVDDDDNNVVENAAPTLLGERQNFNISASPVPVEVQKHTPGRDPRAALLILSSGLISKRTAKLI